MKCAKHGCELVQERPTGWASEGELVCPACVAEGSKPGLESRELGKEPKEGTGQRRHGW